MDVALSPDGGQLYELGRLPATIRVFDRAPGNRLIPRPGADGCYNTNGAAGCTPVPGLGSGDVYDLELSPDGTSLYVAAGSSLAHLRRNPATGSLTPAQCYGTGPGCASIAPIGAVYAVEVSNDGQSVYTRGSGFLGAFQRSTSTGALIPEPEGEDCFSEVAIAGCIDSYGLGGNAFEMSFSPDGKFLYDTNQTPGGVGFFQRSANGTLTQMSGPQGGCITTNGNSSAAGECAVVADGSGAAMENAWAATLSPSGRHVFVSGSAGTVVFARDQETGKLTKVDCIAPSTINSCKQRSGSAGMGVAVSPDAKRAIVGSNDVGGIGVYEFDDASGALSQLATPLGCFAGAAKSGCSSFPGGVGWGKAAWAPDGLNFYAVAASPLVDMVVDYPPVCQGGPATVPANALTTLALSCSDPNGDPVTMRVSRPPTAGVLAGIDQAASTVRYSPLAGYVGPDSFGYVGTARGIDSAEATISLEVRSPPPTQKGPLTNPIAASWKPFKTYTQVKKLVVKNATTDVDLRLSCKGHGCPFGVKEIEVKKEGDMSLLSRFNFARKVKGKKRKVVAKLGVGAVVQVQIIAPDRIGKAVRYTMRKGKQPATAVLCTLPGSSRTQASC